MTSLSWTISHLTAFSEALWWLYLEEDEMTMNKKKKIKSNKKKKAGVTLQGPRSLMEYTLVCGEYRLLVPCDSRKKEKKSSASTTQRHWYLEAQKLSCSVTSCRDLWNSEVCARKDAMWPDKHSQIDLIQTQHELNSRSSSHDINYGWVHPEPTRTTASLYILNSLGCFWVALEPWHLFNDKRAEPRVWSSERRLEERWVVVGFGHCNNKPGAYTRGLSAPLWFMILQLLPRCVIACTLPC